MTLEIRKVPNQWIHPVDHDGKYKPMFDENYDQALLEWFRDYMLWLLGIHPKQSSFDTGRHYAEFVKDPPSSIYYRKYDDEDCSYFQVYENVSEGTPLSPILKTRENVIDWLVQNENFSVSDANLFFDNEMKRKNEDLGHHSLKVALLINEHDLFGSC